MVEVLSHDAFLIAKFKVLFG